MDVNLINHVVGIARRQQMTDAAISHIVAALSRSKTIYDAIAWFESPEAEGCSLVVSVADWLRMVEACRAAGSAANQLSELVERLRTLNERVA